MGDFILCLFVAGFCWNDHYTEFAELALDAKDTIKKWFSEHSGHRMGKPPILQGELWGAIPSNMPVEDTVQSSPDRKRPCPSRHKGPLRYAKEGPDYIVFSLFRRDNLDFFDSYEKFAFYAVLLERNLAIITDQLPDTAVRLYVDGSVPCNFIKHLHGQGYMVEVVYIRHKRRGKARDYILGCIRNLIYEG